MIIELVDPGSAAIALGRLGLRVIGEPVALTGGVSNRVYRAETTDGPVVLKQSLEQLLVAEEWHAPRDRILAEAAAMEIYHRLSPQSAPELVAVEAAEFTIVMTAAPAHWTDWKRRLMSGTIEIELAERIGSTLARYVVATDGTPLPAIDDPQRFRDLRIAPYFEATAARRPDLAEQLNDLILEVTSRHDVLVHGDFSPKNILTDGHEFWITDFEVAHVGDAEFDAAFLASHLVLKCIASPHDAPFMKAALAAFVGGYLRGTGACPGSAHLGRVVAALLAARIDGRSTVEYLESHQRDEVRILAKQWLFEPIGFWSFLEGKDS